MLEAKVEFTIKKGTNRQTRTGRFLGCDMDLISVQIHEYVGILEKGGWGLIATEVKSITRMGAKKKHK
jgi:hypothetical protein